MAYTAENYRECPSCGKRYLRHCGVAGHCWKCFKKSKDQIGERETILRFQKVIQDEC